MDAAQQHQADDITAEDLERKITFENLVLGVVNKIEFEYLEKFE